MKVVALEDESIVAYINHAEHVTCLACSVDDKYMVTGSADKTLKIWEMFNGKLIQVCSILYYSAMEMFTGYWYK